MKVLFLTLVRLDKIEDRGIYQDLLRKFRDNNHEVTVVYPSERKYGLKTKLIEENSIKRLSVWTPNIQKTNLLEKGIATILIEYFYYFAIRKFLKYDDFDLILYSTPPITFSNLIMWLKKKSNALTYLLLKDIFPQNAVDLNYIKPNSYLHKYFRNKEIALYEISDFIGCMSPANLKFLLLNNKQINISKLEVNPNTIDVSIRNYISNKDLLIKYNIPNDKTIYLFGGNLGAPQAINLLKQNIENCKSIKEAFFVIIGDGTEYEAFKKWTDLVNIKNVILIRELPKSEYEDILSLAHVGLIFLNPLFTIPNFPSRVLSYMQFKLPIICATDSITDIGKIASDNNFGYSCLTSDLDTFFEYVVKLLDKDLRVQMGQNSFDYLLNNYNIDVSYNKIIEKIN
ncbi:glycosyltransferase family 4 protein [Aquirufa antheringensis]|uniref:glycosyltransferase family 4 protein n=1 Tax=Pseudomonadati TaxID=3379134 RepID=UPI003BB15356